MDSVLTDDITINPAHSEPSSGAFRVLQVPSESLTGLHSAQFIGSDGDNLTDDNSGPKKHRERLTRRLSYRQILSDLSLPSVDLATLTMAKIEDTDSSSSDDEVATNLSKGPRGMHIHNTGMLHSQLKMLPGHLSSHGDSGAAQGLQTLTMSNAPPASVSPPGGATLVQYAQAADGQFLIPGNMQYQLGGTPSLPPGVMMASGGLGSGHGITEEVSRKRELRLLKNREAARECRRKKKEYVKCLENRVAVLENQNKTLIEELKSLKELYCQKDLGQS